MAKFHNSKNIPQDDNKKNKEKEKTAWSVSEFKQKYTCNIFIQRKKNLVKYIKASTYSVTKEKFSIVNKSKKKKTEAQLFKTRNT